MPRRITIFTGTRAEYGLLRGIISRLATDARVQTRLCVSGAHLSPLYGNTLDEISADAFVAPDLIDIGLGDDSKAGICRGMGHALEKYGVYIAENMPDLLCVLGDRYESFCAVAAASVCGIPVAHLYGGEITEGAIDDAFRHAMTKMAHLHFTSCERYRQRILQMGENPNRVWVAGAIGIENARLMAPIPDLETRAFLNLPSQIPYVICTWHPVTIAGGDSAREVSLILDALAARPDLHYVFTGANADAGGNAINEILKTRSETDSRMRFFMSLGNERYIQAVRHSAGVLGNSSSAVGECPSLGVPVLDIGDRQKGRERSPAVLHCELSPEELARNLELMFSDAIRERAKNTPNPLERPHPAQTITEILATYPLEGILRKKFHDLDFLP